MYLCNQTVLSDCQTLPTSKWWQCCGRLHTHGNNIHANKTLKEDCTAKK